MNKIEQRNRYFQAKDNGFFLSLLRELEEKMPPKAIAAEAGIKLKTYYSIRKGILHWPEDKYYILCELYEPFIEFLLPKNFQVIRAINAIGSSPRSIRRLEIFISILDGKVKEKTEEALEDKKITVKEYNEIHREINKARRTYAELDISILQKVSP